MIKQKLSAALLALYLSTTVFGQSEIKMYFYFNVSFGYPMELDCRQPSKSIF